MKNKATRGKEDRISSLPDDVRLQILTFLPLSEAVKTSLLSTQWRNLWTNLPSLNFDENCGVTVPARYNYDRNAVNALMLKLCKILLLHRGPLIDFSLSLPMLRRFPDQIELILLLLQDKHVESLTMRTTRWFLIPPSPENTEDYKLPMRLLTSFLQLKTLRLSDCELKWSPISFEGFRILTVLELRNVVFKDHSDLWRFRLPMLSSLTLDSCAGSTLSPHIVIEAPNLGCFHFVGFYQSLHLKHTPVLKNAIIHKRRLMFSSDLQDKSNLLRIWGDLASVETLCVADHFYQVTLFSFFLCLYMSQIGWFRRVRLTGL
ncbi:F-box/FBD/LRR-repeat protein At1g13570 [Linum perenne]